MSSTPLQDKVVIVTGAASGIGLATAKKLDQLGALLVLSDIDEKALSTKAQGVSGNRAHKVKMCDVGNPHEVNKLIQEALDHYGRIDHVFNCAGVNPTAMPLEETPDEYWDKLVNTNLKGAFNVTRACIPHMKAGGSFVNVASILGTTGSAQNAVYCATKYGVIGFSKSMALELGPKGIRTNVVAPGFINTPTNNSVIAGAQAMAETEKKVGLGRMGTADEVADVVAFLLSHEARYMNGSVVEINGGL